MTRILATALAIFIIAPSVAEARHHHRYHHYRHHYRPQMMTDRLPTVASVVSHPSGCPGRAFCGCGVSVSVFGRPVRDLYLARNWYRFPRTYPAAGMVAVRGHHVMKILAYDGNGNATVYDPNSGGHRTRVHTRSLAGFTVVNPLARTALAYMDRG